MVRLEGGGNAGDAQAEAEHIDKEQSEEALDVSPHEAAREEEHAHVLLQREHRKETSDARERAKGESDTRMAAEAKRSREQRRIADGGEADECGACTQACGD